MKKKILIGIIAVAALIKGGFYISPVKVVDNAYGNVYAEDEYGNVWSWNGDPENIGDKHIFLMYTGYTHKIEDDIITCKAWKKKSSDYVYTCMNAVPEEKDLLKQEYTRAVDEGWRN